MESAATFRKEGLGPFLFWWLKLIVNDAVLQVVRSFLKDSIYQNMTPLFIGPTVLFVSKEPKAKEMLTTLRASPQMTLLGMDLLSICMTEGMLFLLQTKIVLWKITKQLLH